MARFPPAFQKLLTAEGEYAPKDGARGAVHYGITQRTLRLLNYPHSADFMRTMPLGFAEEFYRTEYWHRYRLGEIDNQRIAETLLLALINTSPSAVIRLLQESICELEDPITVDGLIGPQTIGALNRARNGEMLLVLKGKLGGRYKMLAARNPGRYGPYLNGWLGRLELT